MKCCICNKNHNISNLFICNNLFTIMIKKYININITKIKKEIKQIKTKIKYKCDICNKIMKTAKNYNYHIQNNVCIKVNKLKCNKCNKIFTDKRSLIYHINNNVCKNINNNKINNNEISTNINNPINIQTQNIQTQNNQNNHNHNNINNININLNNTNDININLNNTNDIQKVVDMIPFRNVKYNISPEKYLEYAKYPERAIKSFIKDEHFNPNKPERMNILNTNRRDNKVQVLDRDDYDEIRWMIKSKTDINELLYDRGVNHLYVAKNILEANGIFLDARTKQRLNDKINEYETDDKSKKEQIDMISDFTYNYRDIVETNKKINNKLIKN